MAALSSRQKPSGREIGSTGMVLELGPDCYKDPSRFPSVLCKQGDWILLKVIQAPVLACMAKSFA